jgi:hypothetical protein
VGFFLTSFQVAVDKELVGTFKSSLGALPTITGEPTGNDHAYSDYLNESYG